MRAVLQRVSRASVEVEAPPWAASSEAGWYCWGSRRKTQADARWLAEKVLNLRGFEDDLGKMNLSVVDVGGRHSGCQPIYATG